MLELKKISKIYLTEDIEQKALDEVSINFRKNEFASILGPSGSGKTTLLNIIGGLDQYSKGDLIIGGISTKEYRDSDWDLYRNNKVGFVFQSYNLIPHQSILSNVELALTLSGVNKKEREKRAKEVLVKVGLKDHINKRPNQLSGGQMQRVAIARALVNNPDIILADEPTGALDSDTSIQIMKLLKEVAKDKLVIMVTHNPELTEQYSTRIIKLKDGKIIDDSDIYEGDNLKESINRKKTSKTSMTFFTALGLSFNNLMTKRGRTILVAFAGSIGIIGIALIMSLSNGFQNYIDSIQEDTLSSYPLTIASETADMTSMLLSMTSGEEGKGSNTGTVKENQIVSSMFSNVSTNDLKSFRRYLNDNNDEIKRDISSIKYLYSVSPYIYTVDAKKNLSLLNPSSLFSTIYSSNIASMYSSYSSIFSQMIDNHEKLDEQYEVLAGRWPEKFNEMIIVLPDSNTISDLLVYSLGLRDTKELKEMITKIMAGEKVDINNEPLEFSYEDLMNIDLRLINQYETYKYNKKYNIYEDMKDDKKFMESLYNDGVKLNIVGVVTLKEGKTAMTLSPGVAYQPELMSYIIDEASKSDIVKKQLKNDEINVLSNKRFDDETKKSQLDFSKLISVDTEMMQKAFNIKIDQNDIKSATTQYMNNISNSITVDSEEALNDFLNKLDQMSRDLLNKYTESPIYTVTSNNIPAIQMSDVEKIVDEYLTKNSDSLLELENKYGIPSDIFKNTYNQLITGLIKAYILEYYKKDQSVTIDSNNIVAILNKDIVDVTVKTFTSQAIVVGTSETMAQKMIETKMKRDILTNVGNLTTYLTSTFSNSFNVDKDKIAKAFKFNLGEDELVRIMTSMTSSGNEETVTSNLIKLGYQDIEDPTSISFYFNSFDTKEDFLSLIDKYNQSVKDKGEEEKEINYTDTTGILMSSVKTVVNTVSYVLIAFVSISLVVSSIMIGIITYISVLERTKEIGILRAVGASKKDIKRVFNAETVIEGIISGMLGIGITMLLCIPINLIIQKIINVKNIATLPLNGAIGLVILSVILTVIAGAIPSRVASKKDPVESLRSE